MRRLIALCVVSLVVALLLGGNGTASAQLASGSIESVRTKALNGDIDAQMEMARIYAEGEDVEQSNEEALEWYRKAAEGGNADAQSVLGHAYGVGQLVPQNYKLAFSWYEKAAEQGNDYAQYNLGVMYDRGQGVLKDHVQAAKWYRLAADQGLAPAQFSLATMYRVGEGVKQDNDESISLYRKAAEQGNVLAQYNLANFFYSGEGVEKDYAEALKWFRKAAEQELPEAQYYMGQIYTYGNGVQSDIREGVNWYLKAAHNGFPGAQTTLGTMYSRGIGVQTDRVTGYMWLELGSVAGNETAISVKNMLSKNLSSRELEEGKRLAREWKGNFEKQTGLDSNVPEAPDSNKPRVFPTGKFDAVQAKIELPTGQTVYATDFHTFDATLEVKDVGKDLISYQLNARIRLRANTQEKKERRLDKFKIVWTEDDSGKLVNQDPTYRNDETDFTISGDELVIKSWVSRNKTTETQTYRKSMKIDN